MKKVIFLKYSPLSRKVYEDYCMPTLISEGYEVEYWDLTYLFNFTFEGCEPFRPSNNLRVLIIRTYKELSDQVKVNHNSLYIIMMTCWLNQFKLLRTLSKENGKIAFWGPDPVISLASPFYKRIKRISLKKIYEVTAHYLMYFLLRINVVNYYNYYFSVGLNGFKQIGIYDRKLLSKSIALPIHSSDYNNYHFTANDSFSYNNQRFMVFIDQYLPFHPDNIILKRNGLSQEQYYSRLNDCFNVLENEFRMPVLIAAHPKAQKYKETNYFNGRTVLFGETHTLIKQSQLVLAHFSTAISYAVMSYKPMLFLNSSLFDNKYDNHYFDVLNFAHRFGAKAILMENFQETKLSDDIMRLSPDQVRKYESYICDYCTSNIIDKPNEVLVLEYISQLFDK